MTERGEARYTHDDLVDFLKLATFQKNAGESWLFLAVLDSHLDSIPCLSDTGKAKLREQVGVAEEAMREIQGILGQARRCFEQ